MPVQIDRALARAAVAVGAVLLAGCNALDYAAVGFAGVISPYKIEVVQGNFISKEQVESLQPGMSREQVKQILGTPLVSSLFHADRWDYVFTLRRQGVESQKRRLTVFFDGNSLKRHEGDAMPSEAEFVATLDNRRKSAKVPPLEASEEKLKAFSAEKKPADPGPNAGAAATAAAAAALPPAPTSYPPLEPPTR